jgi:hypothetical protein
MFISMPKTKPKKPREACGPGNFVCLGSGEIKDDTEVILNIIDKQILKKYSLPIKFHDDIFYWQNN